MKALLIVLAMLGCKDTDEKAMNEWLVKDAKKSIAKLEASLQTAQTSTSVVECGHMGNIAVLEKLDRAVADQLRQLCTTDIHIAVMRTQIDAIEAKRKVKPKDELGIDCMDPFYEFAKNEMTKAGTLDAAKATIARYEALCPPAEK
jgi:hypothetical protein